MAPKDVQERAVHTAASCPDLNTIEEPDGKRAGPERMPGAGYGGVCQLWVIERASSSSFP